MSDDLHANKLSHSIYMAHNELSQVTLVYIGFIFFFKEREKRKTYFSLLVRKTPEWIRERKKQFQTA